MKKILFFLSIFSHDCFSQTWDWVKSYSNGSNTENIGTSIGTDNSGNLYITGDNTSYTGGPGGAFNYYRILYKFTSAGNLLWKDTLSTGNLKSVTDSIGNTYMVGGMTVSKYNNNGQLLWVKTYMYKSFKNLSIHPLGGIVIVGFTNSGGNQQSVMYRLDTNGNELWNRLADFGYCDVTACDKLGNTYIAGENLQNNTVIASYIKIDNSGNQIATKVIPQDPTNLRIGNDFSVYVFGSFSSSAQSNSLYISKYDDQNNNMWTKYLSGKNLNGKGMILDKQNNIFLTGSFLKTMNANGQILTTDNVGLYITKISPMGSIVWTKNSNGYNSEVQPYDLVINSNSEIFFTGYMIGNSFFDTINVNVTNLTNVCFGKINQPTVTFLPSQKKTEQIFTIYPSPTSGLFNIECGGLKNCDFHITITNSVGQKVYTESNPHFEGNYSKVFDLGRLAKGIYFVEVNTGEQRTVKKVVLE